MKTFLLVAGQSKRFWPLSEKPLFPICGKTLLQHIVRRLERAGCIDIVFIGSKHNLEDVRSLYPTAAIVEQEDLQLGMRGAMLSALPTIGDEEILIVSANDVIESSAYAEVVRMGRGAGADGAILAKKVDRYFPGGYLSTAGGRVTGIVEKPGAGNEPSDLVTIVCHHHRSSAALLRALQDVDPSTDDGYEQALATLFETLHYQSVPYEGAWQAVKYPWHLLELLPLLLKEIATQSIDPSASIHPTAVIEGPVMIEENVRILPHATIVGPCHLGRGTIVGNNALVRGSSIGEHCVVGYNSEVKSSILHSHVWTHSTYIGDSVIGQNVSFGAGCVTGNLRLDEGEIQSHVGEERIGTGLRKFGTIIGNNCRLGIHTAINPGIKIGSGTFVGSGALVEQDLPSGSFARMKKGELVVGSNSAVLPAPNHRDDYRKKL